MAANNTTPVFIQNSSISYCKLKKANNNFNGTGNNVQLLFTAGPNGSFVDKIRIQSMGTNSASVFRLYLNNGLDRSNPDNNSLLYEYSLAAVNASEGEKKEEHELILNLNIQGGYKFYCSCTTLAANNNGWAVTCIAGDY